jgi:hypothetical protein
MRILRRWRERRAARRKDEAMRFLRTSPCDAVRAAACLVALATTLSTSAAHATMREASRSTATVAQDAPKATPPAEAKPEGGDRGDGDGSRARRGGRMLPPDWPRAGGFGPDAERPMIEGLVLQGLLSASEQRRAPSDAEIEKAIAVAKEISPEWGAALEARAKEEPGRMRTAFGGGARRLLALVALKERAPKIYAARVGELKAQAATARAASDLRAVEADATATADKKTAATAAFDAAVARQVDATLAARSEELDALEARLAALRSALAADRAKHSELVEGVKTQAREASAREASPEGAPSRAPEEAPRE